MESLLFTPAKIGPIEIKNRVIRASAYEGMCDGHVPTGLRLHQQERSVLPPPAVDAS